MTDAGRLPAAPAPAEPDGIRKPPPAAGPSDRGQSTLVWPPPEADLAGFEVVQLDDTPVGVPELAAARPSLPAAGAGATAPAASEGAAVSRPASLPVPGSPAGSALTSVGQAGPPGALATVRDALASALSLSTSAGADAARWSLKRVGDLAGSLRPGQSTEAAIDEAPPSRRRRAWAVVATVAIILLVSVVGLVRWRPGSATTPEATPLAEARLLVETTSPGAHVLLNGEARGTTPLLLSLAPGKWRLEVESATDRRTLDLELAPGSKATYVFDLRADRPSPTRVPAPRRARPPAGPAAPAPQPVEAPAAGPASSGAEVETGVVSFNATPWAEVWIDGQRLGETPLGNVRLPVGAHEVVFRHPQLGERRAVAVVRASTPERVTVSFER